MATGQSGHEIKVVLPNTGNYYVFGQCKSRMRDVDRIES